MLIGLSGARSRRRCWHRAVCDKQFRSIVGVIIEGGLLLVLIGRSRGDSVGEGLRIRRRRVILKEIVRVYAPVLLLLVIVVNPLLVWLTV